MASIGPRAVFRRGTVRGRRAYDFAFRSLTIVALLLIVGPVIWVVVGILRDALPHWRWAVLWTTTQGAGGGLLNAIVGTLVLMGGVLVIAGTIGVLAGIYLAELATPSKRGGGSSVIRLAIDVLSGFPSIVLGYVGFVALVVGLHWGFSLLPAWLILSMMVLPYIAKSTETALRQVPTSYRESAEALGMSTGYALRKVVVRSAVPGIVTGLILALAIAGGETAPLIYTAGWSVSTPSLALTHSQVAYLTYPVWTFYNYPSNQAHYLAYDAALLLLVMVLILIVISRLIVWRTQRHSESRPT